MGYIYKITCIPTQKIYIGKTQTSVAYRWTEHCKVAFLPSHGDYNFPFHRAIRKYGKDSFIIETIDEVKDNEELKQKEIFWIKKYNSYYNGYNATLGGDGNNKYNYDDIVEYYLSHNYSLSATCEHFGIYDQVVYSALRGKNISYTQLKSTNRRKHNKKIRCVELDIVFDKMKDIDIFFGKQVHSNIRRCLNGVTKKAYGYTWEEVD